MRAILAIIFLLMLNSTFGQKAYLLEVNAADQPREFFKKKFSYNDHPKDQLKARAEAADLLNKLRSYGYMAASIDSLKGDTLKTTAYIYVGEKFENLILRNGNVDERLLGDAGVKNAVLSGKPINVNDAIAVKQKLLTQCENTGYPFATTRLDSFAQSNGMYSARIYLTKHDLVKYDTIKILGKTKIKMAFLKNYLGIKPNRTYNEANVKRITQRIADLAFVEPIQPNTVAFYNGKAKVNLYLKDKRASQFDLLIGFLPGSSGKKLLVTGEANLHLVSPFGMGEEFSLAWQKLQPKTQTLNIKVVYPYLIGLPLGISAKFDLYKRDTTYVDIDGDYGVQYQLAGSNYIKASLKQKTTIITNVDTAYIKSYRTLPQNIDLSSNEFALEFYYQKLNYKFNPVSGFAVTLNGSAGLKVTKRNNNIAQLFDEVTGRNFSYLYDTTRLKAFQFRVGFVIDKYWKLAPRHTIKTSFDGKYFFTHNIYQNEKYRLGGINSLRGFDDQSIFTPYYAMADVEYRFLLSKNSYFSGFFNGALVQNIPTRKGPFDFPFGFGVSAAVETKAGIFGIVYAMGKQLDNNISFKNAKIHFGYVNYF